MDKTYKIYRYVGPTGKSYIGQTNQSLTARSGLRGQQYWSSPKFYNAIQKYGFEYFKAHRCVLKNGLTKEQADRLEKYYIQFFDSINNGYNIQDGGTFSTRLMFVKPIVGINCETKEIEYFESETDAAKQKQLNRRSIGKVVTHEPNHYTYGGYVWIALQEWNEYSETQKQRCFNIQVNRKNVPKKVVCMNNNKIYSSIKDAQAQTGINNISACCRHKIKSAGCVNGEQAVWRYADEIEELKVRSVA